MISGKKPIGTSKSVIHGTTAALHHRGPVPAIDIIDKRTAGLRDGVPLAARATLLARGLEFFSGQCVSNPILERPLQLVKYQAIICHLFTAYSAATCLKYDSLFRQPAARDKSKLIAWDHLKEDILVWCATRQPVLGTTPGNFNTHSFRIGAATAAARADLPTETIKQLGRWRSDAYSVYVRHTPNQSLTTVQIARAP